MSSRQPYNVMFLCTGNSARSVMAEAIMNRRDAPDYRAFSACSRATGTVHSDAISFQSSI